MASREYIEQAKKWANDNRDGAVYLTSSWSPYDHLMAGIIADALTAAEEERDRLRSAFAPELIAESTRLHVENDQLAKDRRELMEALELIEGNFYDAREVARNALDKIKAREAT